jgi:hypothetical protein
MIVSTADGDSSMCVAPVTCLSTDISVSEVMASGWTTGIQFTAVTVACGGKITHLQFTRQLVHNLVFAAQDQSVNGRGIQQERPNPASS